MNLHQIVKGAINIVNPFINAILRRSDGIEAGKGASRTPKYKPDEIISIQLQPLTSDDLRHIDGLNLQGIVKSIHTDGNIYGTLRREAIGGDLIIINGVTWLVIEPIELWPDWCRLLVRRQDDDQYTDT